MDYDERYRRTESVFGSAPERILREYATFLPRERPVLDVGAGQGRNTLFLARRGFEVDAIDPSAVAIDTIRNLAEPESLQIRLYTCGFDDFTPEVDTYSGILLFGLIQILPWDAIDLLVDFARRRLHPSGILFVTGFTTADPSCVKYMRDWRSLGRNSFSDGQGNVRTYLEPGELLSLFPEYEAVHYWEGIGPEHHHGDGQMEHHALAEAVMRPRQRPPDGQSGSTVIDSG